MKVIDGGRRTFEASAVDGFQPQSCIAIDYGQAVAYRVPSRSLFGLNEFPYSADLSVPTEQSDERNFMPHRNTLCACR